MHGQPSRQRFHAIWATLLVALVVISCLNKTLTASTQLLSSQWRSQSSALNNNHLQQLYFSHFTAQIDTPSSSEDSCHLISQTQPQIQSKTDWLAPFLVLCLIALLANHVLVHHSVRLSKVSLVPKRRLHLTQCVFRE